MAGKGSNPRPYGVNKATFDSNYDAIFGKKEKNHDVDPETGRVRYKAHPETGAMIPDYMWAQYGMNPPPVPKTHHIMRDAKDYKCPVNEGNKMISGRRQHRENLKRTGCRVYEGRGSEQRAADSHVAHEDKKLDREVEKTLGKTLNDMRHGNNAPIERAKDGSAKNSWTFGL